LHHSLELESSETALLLEEVMDKHRAVGRTMTDAKWGNIPIRMLSVMKRESLFSSRTWSPPRDLTLASNCDALARHGIASGGRNLQHPCEQTPKIDYVERRRSTATRQNDSYDSNEMDGHGL
jgi:hypothetical protein